MKNIIVRCNSCKHEFKGEDRPSVYSCPKCGSMNTVKYDPSSILSVLAARLSAGGG